MAKKAVDSTIKKILTYTGEIVASILLLIFISIPLAFAVPGWIQLVLFDTPKADLLINPVLAIGIDGTVIALLGLALLGFILGYPATMKLIIREKSDVAAEEEKDETKEEEIEEIEETAEAPVESEEVGSADEEIETEEEKIEEE